MLYLGGDKGWVRKELVKDALGDPVAAAGTEAGSVEAARQQRHQRRRPALDGGTGQEARST